MFKIVLIITLCISIILSSMNLFTNVYDNFGNEIYTNCDNIQDSSNCVSNVNCRLYNVGGNRNSAERCGQSAVATGAIGNPVVLT